MSFTESYSNLVVEYKAKLKQQQEDMGIFKNKLQFSTTVNQMNNLFITGAIKPTQIKPITWSKYFYSFFK